MFSHEAYDNLLGGTNIRINGIKKISQYHILILTNILLISPSETAQLPIITLIAISLMVNKIDITQVGFTPT